MWVNGRKLCWGICSILQNLAMLWGQHKHNATISLFTPASWLPCPTPLSSCTQPHTLTEYTQNKTYKSSWLWSAHLALVLKLSSTWSWISWPTSFVLVCLILISDPGKTRAGVPQDYLAWSSMWFHRSGPAPGCMLLLYHRLTDENAGSQCVGVVASRRVFHLSNRE